MLGFAGTSNNSLVEIPFHVAPNLFDQCRLGSNTSVDLQLVPHDIVQPDLFFVSMARKSIMPPSRIKGVPNLVVEILSPSNTGQNTKIKCRLYERSGIPEYWIVDFAREPTGGGR
ncbi:Uma2 family endonuclease [Pirellulaceae bacterium SH501]